MWCSEIRFDRNRERKNGGGFFLNLFHVLELHTMLMIQKRDRFMENYLTDFPVAREDCP